MEITNQGLDFDGATELTPAQIASATVEIVDGGLNVIVATSAMTWDATRGLWYFMWDTTGHAAGAYQAKVVLTGHSGAVSFDYLTIRLTAPKF